ncbi:MAG: hypothetical protein Q8P81_04215 [Nanoarchaeota archaeon]|nr:hypothetical protein [Nanoarchaeota archaeon]
MGKCLDDEMSGFSFQESACERVRVLKGAFGAYLLTQSARIASLQERSIVRPEDVEAAYNELGIGKAYFVDFAEPSD